MYKLPSHTPRLNIAELSQPDKLDLCKFLSKLNLKFYIPTLHDIPGDGTYLITDLEVKPPLTKTYHSITIACNPTRVKSILKSGKYLEIDLYKAMMQVIPSDPYLHTLCDYGGLHKGVMFICHTTVS